MTQIVDVRIDDCCQLDRYVAHNLDLRRGDPCVVHTSRGMELGRVILATPAPDPLPEQGQPRRKVLRKANNRDFGLYQHKRQRETRAMEIATGMIHRHELQMKLTQVEALFDGSKIIFYYTAEKRVDFRSLVRDLAAQLRTRIEMRQIGVRDEARLLGGVGCCGLPLCCATWLHGFQPISIKSAKKQCANLNPSRLSGVCGRLMCCLVYERDSPPTGGNPGTPLTPDSPDEPDELTNESPTE